MNLMGVIIINNVLVPAVLLTIVRPANRLVKIDGALISYISFFAKGS
jgi:hypothetical protein